MTAGLIVIAAVFGLLIGSFLTVVTERVPNGESIVAPGSRCGACGLRLGPLDLVPVFSWLFLGGKCRRCRTSIGIEPLVLELGTASLFVAMTLKFEDSIETIAFCVLAAGEADIYPRMAPTMEWDTAAGHAVLLAAGGRVTLDDERTPLAYGKAGDSFRNPNFIAWAR